MEPKVNPELRGLLVPLARLKPDPKNAREHDERNLAAIEASLRKFGQQKPIVVSRDGFVIAGNGTYAAAKKIGWGKIAATRFDGTLESARAYGIVDNRTQELSSWKLEEIPKIIEEFKEAMPDLSDVMQMDELLDLMDQGGEVVQEDEAPEPPKKAHSKTGDLWILGGHRLLCGDSTKVEAVKRLFGSSTADAVMTDPPYGIDRRGIENDGPAQIRGLFDKVLANLPARNAAVVAFQSPRMFPVWLDAIRAAGHRFERMLWQYDETDQTYPWRGWLMTSQAILVSSIGKPRWRTLRPFAHDCYLAKTAGRETDGANHPTVKPLPIVLDLLARLGGRTVYDPFVGSGTTIAAAEKLGRRCFAIEIAPEFVDVGVMRWQNLTGKRAVSEKGKPFPAPPESRKP